jgi:hypothetical protein
MKRRLKDMPGTLERSQETNVPKLFLEDRVAHLLSAFMISSSACNASTLTKVTVTA